MSDDRVGNEWTGMAGEPVPQVITDNMDLIRQVDLHIEALRPGPYGDFPGIKSLWSLADDLSATAQTGDDLHSTQEKNLKKAFDGGEMGDLIKAALAGDLGRDDIDDFAARMSTPDRRETNELARVLSDQGIGGNAGTELADVLNKPFFKEYYDKLGGLVGVRPDLLNAPMLFTSVIPEYMQCVVIKEEAPAAPQILCHIMDTLSKNELFMKCLETNQYLQGMMMSSLLHAQLNMDVEGFPVEDRMAFFEACAKGRILQTSMNAENVNPNAEMWEDDEDLDVDFSLDTKALLEQANIDSSNLEPLEAAMASMEDYVPYERENLTAFLAHGFSDMDKDAAKKVLVKTNALASLEWDDDIERWAHESQEPIAAAALEVCQSNREVYLANKPKDPGDDLDILSK